MNDSTFPYIRWTLEDSMHLKMDSPVCELVYLEILVKIKVEASFCCRLNGGEIIELFTYSKMII